MSIELATHLWFEAGNMSGGSRNQVEFSDDLITFFDEKSREVGKVFIAFDTNTKMHCPLADRGQEYGQWTRIWRLGLITQAKGGVDYRGRIVCLERRAVGKNFTYVITVADPNSELHNEWIAKSTHTGITAGAEGRRFGYF